MTTFITGATTDLGRVLVREMVQQGEALRLLVRGDSNRSGLELPGVEFIRGDISDGVAVRKGMAGCDRVCHLAGLSAATPDGVDAGRVHQGAARLVMQAAQDMRVRSVVHVSAIGLLSPSGPDGEPADETHTLDPRRLSKSLGARHAADEVARDFAAKGLPVKLVYPGVGYGYVRPPGEGGLAAWTLLRFANGGPATVPGNGHARLPVAYFKDTAQGIMLAHERGREGEGYLLVGETLTWPQMWLAIGEVLGRDAPMRRVPLWLARWTGSLPAEVLDLCRHDWHVSAEKARRELGWRPSSFRDGIGETWEEYAASGMGKRAAAPERAMRRA
jgi:nucleoside-diphosphate-sugar epimerase